MPVVLFVALMLWHLWYYRHTGYEHAGWDAEAVWAANAVRFDLVPKKERMPTSPLEHGRRECHVKLPDGSVLVLHHDDTFDTYDGRLSVVTPVALGEGTFLVTWYGSRKLGRFYEITRREFTLGADRVYG